MKLQIICDKCGKLAELKPYQVGKQVYLNQADGFRVTSVSFDKSGDLEEMSDVDDIDVEVKCIEIMCEECGEFLRIEDIG
ncbi:hypothetical protein [Clostridium sp. UBA5988]|uniref:hypothetical protein n=1 Tax=Clostridium sp. UBA5988 TaxID=1946369 RepID=UPI003216BC4B